MERNKTVTRPEIRRWLRCTCTCHVLFIFTNSRVVVLGKSCQLSFERFLPKVDLHSNVVKGVLIPCLLMLRVAPMGEISMKQTFVGSVQNIVVYQTARTKTQSVSILAL